MRFGRKDLEVLTKRKGSEEPFEKVNLADFIGSKKIPDFDYKIGWRFHKDRMPRRRVTSSRSSSPTGLKKRSEEPVYEVEGRKNKN